MTNALYTCLAYQFTMLVLLNGEADLAISRLAIPERNKIAFEELRLISIPPANFWQGGALHTERFMFGITDHSRHINILDAERDKDLVHRGRVWEKLPSLVDSNGAAALAFQWLRALDVDVAGLNRDCAMQGRQGRLLDGPTTRMLPEYSFEWKDGKGMPTVSVSVFGPDKSPLYIRQDDWKYSGRPKLLAKETEKLLRIPDAIFLTMSDGERQKLVLAHAATNYPNLRFPPRDWFDRRFGPREAAPPAPVKKPANVITVPPKIPDKSP